MSSLSPFIFENIENKHILSLTENSFHAFFTKQLHWLAPDFKPVELSMAGSVAFHFQEVIKNMAKKFEISVTKTVAAPIEKLVDYYI